MYASEDTKGGDIIVSIKAIVIIFLILPDEKLAQRAIDIDIKVVNIVHMKATNILLYISFLLFLNISLYSVNVKLPSLKKLSFITHIIGQNINKSTNNIISIIRVLSKIL